MKITIIKDKCIECGICVEECPIGVITINQKTIIDKARCIKCGACVVSCPKKAIEVK